MDNQTLAATLAAINKRLDEQAEVNNAVAKIVKHLGLEEDQSSPTPLRIRPPPQRVEDEIKLGDLPSFDGDTDPETYLDWERRVERMFEHKQLNDSKRFTYATLKLTKYASTWFESLQAKRESEGKQRLESWSDLKAKMKRKYVPRGHKQSLFMKLNSLRQNNLTVAEYAAELERLYVACDCHEQEEQKIAKFVLGLNQDLRHDVEVQQFNTLEDACHVAMKFEKQQSEKKSASKRPFKVESSSSFSFDEASYKTPTKDVVQAMKQKLTVENSKPEPSNKTVCYKCRGLGHVAKFCPNRNIVSREEYYNFMLHEIEHEEEEKEEPQSLRQLIAKDDTQVIRCEPPNETPLFLVRRSLLADSNVEETNPQRNALFRSNCYINDKVCSLIIDSGSCTNVCALNMAESLQLPIRKHPNSYKLQWLNDSDGMWVRKQALVNFRIGEYKDELWCDALPMTACALLLGRPWQSDRFVMHNGRTNEYSVKLGDTRYLLPPLDPRLYSTRMKEQAIQATTKKERREQILQLRKESELEVGDRVWLTLHAQMKQYNAKHGEPLDEGPFEVVELLDYGQYKVDLGDGICATLGAGDLVPCLPKD